MQPTSASDTVILVAAALGSNLAPAPRAPFTGEATDGRQRALEGALVGFRAFGWHVLATSSLHETSPVGVGPQPDFLNACALLAAPRQLAAVLGACQGLERAAGRRGKGDGAARPLDIDLLEAWVPSDEQSWLPFRTAATPGLTLPHPRLRERAFVLLPLREILPLAPESPPTEGGLGKGPASAAFPQAWTVPAPLGPTLGMADPALLSFGR